MVGNNSYLAPHIDGVQTEKSKTYNFIFLLTETILILHYLVVLDCIQIIILRNQFLFQQHLKTLY